jgi:small subunit ribosomal protein S6
MRKYELVIISKAAKDPKAMAEKIKELLAKEKIKVEKEEDWGTKKLAYPIAHARDGQYLWYLLSVGPDKISAIEKKLKLEEKIIRYLLIRIE